MQDQDGQNNNNLFYLIHLTQVLPKTTEDSEKWLIEAEDGEVATLD